MGWQQPAMTLLLPIRTINQELEELKYVLRSQEKERQKNEKQRQQNEKERKERCAAQATRCTGPSQSILSGNGRERHVRTGIEGPTRKGAFV